MCPEGLLACVHMRAQLVSDLRVHFVAICMYICYMRKGRYTIIHPLVDVIWFTSHKEINKGRIPYCYKFSLRALALSALLCRCLRAIYCGTWRMTANLMNGKYRFYITLCWMVILFCLLGKESVEMTKRLLFGHREKPFNWGSRVKHGVKWGTIGRSSSFVET